MKFYATIIVALSVVCHSMPIVNTHLTTRADLQAETDRLLFTATMAEFQAARSAKSPSELDWDSNGCTASPDEPLGYDFQPSCQRHDFGYHNYKDQDRFSDSSKDKIDSNFKKDMYNECNSHGKLGAVVCKGIANIYYEAVSTFGSKRSIQQ